MPPSTLCSMKCPNRAQVCVLFSCEDRVTNHCSVAAETGRRVSAAENARRPRQNAVVEHHKRQMTVCHQHRLKRVRL